MVPGREPGKAKRLSHENSRATLMRPLPFAILPGTKEQPRPMRERTGLKNGGASTWTFLTNHAHVILCLARSPSMLMRNIAAEVGITERAVQRIIAELRDEGYLTMEREGRRNTYRINVERPLKHPIEAHRRLADLIGLILEGTAKPSCGGAAQDG